MSEFFEKANELSYNDLQRVRLDEEYKIAHNAIIQKAATISEAANFLLTQLTDNNVEPDVDIVKRNFQPPGLLRKLFLGPMPLEIEPTFIGRGWIISTSKVTFGSGPSGRSESQSMTIGRTISLIEDGRLMIGSIPNNDNTIDYGGMLTLEEYPIYGSFKSQTGYISTVQNTTYFKHPSDDRSFLGPRELQNVYSTLHYIEHDLRESGRKLLGIN